MRGDPSPRRNRAPIIGDPMLRQRKTELALTADEISALDELVIKRRCLSRSDYLRLMIEQDYFGNLLLVDDAFMSFAEAIGRGMGGVAAELTAQADLYRLQKGLAQAMKHTPGPWTVEPTLRPDLDDDPMGEYYVQPARDQLSERYFNLDSDAWMDGESDALAELEAIHAENNANARLIAAAPELLDACRQLLLNTERTPFLAQSLDKARAAIAKAETDA